MGLWRTRASLAGLADCVTTASTYIKETLDTMADVQSCPNGYSSQDGGCDESQRLAQQSFATLKSQWDGLLPGLSALFVSTEGSTTKLSDAFELVDKARAVAAELSPAEMCEGRVVLPDDSETVSQNNTKLHSSGSGQGMHARRSAAPVAATQNQLLHQIAQYTSICAGSASGLTDGIYPLQNGGDQANFETCEEAHASVEVPTMEPAFVSTVRVGKVCGAGATHDPAVTGLQVKVRTSLGVFRCGEVAGVKDAMCSDDATSAVSNQYWERQCDAFGAEIASTAVLVVREKSCTPPNAAHCVIVVPSKARLLTSSTALPKKISTGKGKSASFGKIVLNEIQAQGRALHFNYTLHII